MKKVICFIFIILSTALISQVNTKDALLEQADAYYQVGDYEHAIPIYRKVLTMDERDEEALRGLGLSYFKSGNYEKAKQYLHLVILYHDDNATDLSNLSASYSRLNDDANGYKYAKRALELEEMPLTIWNAASLANNISKSDECIQVLDKSTISLHNDFNALYGKCFYQLKDYEKAILKYETFFKNRKPDDEYADLDLETEKKYLDFSYLSRLGEENIDPAEKRRLLKQVKEMFAGVPQEDLEKSFFIVDNVCSKYALNDTTCAEAFRYAIGDDISELAEIKSVLYLQRDFQKAEELAGKYLRKERDNAKNFDFKLVQYEAALGLLLEDFVRNRNVADDRLLKNARDLFDGFYSGKKFTEKDFEATSQLLLPYENTIVFLRYHFAPHEKNREMQQQLILLITKVMANFPLPEAVEMLKNKSTRLW